MSIEVRKIGLMLTLALAVVIGGGSVSEATFELRITSSLGPSITITDETGADNANGIPGFLSWTGSLGGTTLSVVGGFGYPVVGSTTIPTMDLSWNVTKASGAEESVTFELSQTGFLLNPAELNYGFGGTNSGTTTSYQIGYGTNLFDYSGGTSTVLGPFGGFAYSGQNTYAFNSASTPYSLTQRVVVSKLSGRDNASGDAHLAPVPEPTTLAAWGLLSLCGAGGLIRRRWARG